MNIQFDFSIGEKVQITDLNISGYVVGLYYGETGKQYEVTYFYEGEKKKIYIYGQQLQKIETAHSAGFIK